MQPKQLSNDEVERYSRHLLLREVGLAGQQRLKSSSVLCVGAGGLGSPAAMYLAAAGIGRVGILDADRVEISNLQRQLLHGTRDVSSLKAESARRRLLDLNPQVEVLAHAVRISASNAIDLIQPYDFVLDGSDNFATRYLINDACVLLGKPNIYGAVFQFEGQASVFAPRLGGPCYRCLYPAPPPAGSAPSCAEAGVLGVVPGLVGCIQAAEVLKLALNIGTSLVGRLLLVDALRGRYREVKVQRDAACPVCGDNPSITVLRDLDLGCTASTASGATTPIEEVSIRDLAGALQDPHSTVTVLDVRERSEAEFVRIPGAQLFPLSEIENWAERLFRDRTYFIHCKSGHRSLQAAEFLRQRGFQSVKSVRGGIVAWADEIDPSLPKY